MRIRCPHCRNPIELVEDSPLVDVSCPSCGSSFSLTTSDTTASLRGSSRKIAHFELVRELGIGKFGSVWLAKDTQLDRSVAIKLPRKDALNAEESALFLRDARAAAQLKHPGIVSVHEVGREGDTLYIVSDYIEGASLKDWLAGQQLSFRESAELVAKIARALHHAHESGVIHRDLKPGNIMMDQEGEPHVIDFGLAKRDAGEITMTMDGHILGTPAYMSPEQAKGKGHDADRRSDVYSLGVILYELLTGELPFRGTTQMLLWQIQREEPPRPRKLNGRIPRDLETIVLKCLEKEPGRRYPTAIAVADDLTHYLNGMPISARPVGRIERSWRWTRRNPVVASLVAVATLAMISGTLVSSYFAADALSQKRLAEKSASEALAQERLAKAEKLRADEQAQEALSNAEKAKAAEHRADEKAEEASTAAAQAVKEKESLSRMLYATNMRQAQRALEGYNIRIAQDTLRQLAPKPGEPDVRGWEWHYLSKLCEPELRTLRSVQTVSFFSNQEVIVSERGDIGVYNVYTGNRTWTLDDLVRSAHVRAYPSAGAPASPHIAIDITTGPIGGALQLVNMHSRTLGMRINRVGEFNSVALRPDGKFVATASDAGVKIWDASSVHIVRSSSFPAAPSVRLFYSPDNRILAISDNNQVRLEDADTGQLLSLLEVQCRALAFHPNGKTLVVATRNSELHIFEAPNGSVIRKASVGRAVDRLAFSPNGHWVGLYGPDRAVCEVWNGDFTEEVNQLQHDGPVESISFSEDSRLVATTTKRGNSFVWPAERSEENKLDCPIGDKEGIVAMDLGGTRYATIDYSRSPKPAVIRVRQVGKGNALSTLLDNGETGVHSGVFNSDATLLAAIGDRSAICVWDACTGRQLARLDAGPIAGLDAAARVWPRREAAQVAFDEKSKALVAVSVTDVSARDGGQPTTIVNTTTIVSITRWNCQTWKEEGKYQLPLADVAGVLGITPDGVEWAGTDSSGRVHRVNVQSGDWQVTTVKDKGCWPGGVFSRDGKLYASCKGGEAYVVEVCTGDCVQTIRGPLPIQGIALSPDGRRCVTASEQMVQLWDTDSGAELLSLPSVGVTMPSFSADGWRVLLVGDGITIYDAHPVSADQKMARFFARSALHEYSVVDEAAEAVRAKKEWGQALQEYALEYLRIHGETLEERILRLVSRHVVSGEQIALARSVLAKLEQRTPDSPRLDLLNAIVLWREKKHAEASARLESGKCLEDPTYAAIYALIKLSAGDMEHARKVTGLLRTQSGGARGSDCKWRVAYDAFIGENVQEIAESVQPDARTGEWKEQANALELLAYFRDLNPMEARARGQCLAMSGEFNASAREYERQYLKDGIWNVGVYATLLYLRADEVVSYQAMCRRLLQPTSSECDRNTAIIDPYEIYWKSVACVVGANSGVDLSTVLERLQRAIELEKQNPALLGILGVTYYRMGKLPEARDALKKAVNMHSLAAMVVKDQLLELRLSQMTCQTFLAITLKKLGEEADAAKALSAAQKVMGQLKGMKAYETALLPWSVPVGIAIANQNLVDAGLIAAPESAEEGR